MAAPKFEITKDYSNTGFHTHVTIDLSRPIEDQLQRRTLSLRAGADRGDPHAVRKIIENNASLRLGFGWSFESERLLSDMMEECLYELCDNFNSSMPSIVSDLRGDWIGFQPYNAFEQYEIEQLSIYGMVLFNNELVNYQTDVTKFIIQHKSFRQHAIVRDRNYRYTSLKAIRKSPDDLEDAFHYYMSALRETTGVPRVPRNYIEEAIGVHFLHHSDLFFELMDFYALKGMIHE